MTDSLFPRLRADRHEYAVEPARDRQALARILNEDRLFAAYAIAQLEPEAFSLSEWWTSQTSKGLSLICHSRGGLGDATFMLGPVEGVAAILSIHPGRFQTFATARPDHLPALQRVHAVSTARTMLRMHATADTFTPIDGEAVRLQGTHVRALNRLYSSEGGPTSYQPRHIEEGCYYGVVQDDRLVAVAGTHAISPTYEIGVVGNVFTHPTYRGRGFATIATSAVTAHLLPTCRDVVLSVEPGNRPAVQAYRKLGYEDAGEIVEAAARRRVSGIAANLRRMLAAFRGRRRGVEIVRL